MVNTTFRNYEDNATRKTGAISNLLFSSFGVSTNNAFERLNFVNAKPVYFPPMANNSKWASDNGTSASYKTAAYRDRDGSLGGGPNSYVLIHDGVNDSIAVDTEACEIKPTWNAAVCKGDVGRLTFAGPGGPGGGGFGGARGAGPGGAGGAGPGAAGPGAAAGPGGPPAPLAVLVPAHLAVLVQRPVPADPLLAGRRVPGAFGGGAGGPPAQPPVVLSRNGKEYTVTGTNVRAGTEIKVTTERPSLHLNVTELDRGSWVHLPAAGIHHRSLGCAAGQPRCAAQGQRDLVLQGQGCTLGQGGLQR